jgi:hypothetical protein
MLYFTDKARAADFLSRNLPTSKNDQVITVKKDEVPKGNTEFGM